MRAQFITAEEVQQILSVSRSKSYQIIRDLNKELKSMGYHTISGKCPIQLYIPRTQTRVSVKIDQVFRLN